MLKSAKIVFQFDTTFESAMFDWVIPYFATKPPGNFYFDKNRIK